MSENFELWVQHEVVPSINNNALILAKRIQVIYNLLNNLPLGKCECTAYELAEFDHLCLVGTAEIMQQIGEGIYGK